MDNQSVHRGKCIDVKASPACGRMSPGESLKGIAVNSEDTPQTGGMIARNPNNPLDQWYVNQAYFEAYMEEVSEA